ncbi:MAG: hypothetical protein Q9186_003130 [Xanthomendoza sp. 1 TL-2023]
MPHTKLVEQNVYDPSIGRHPGQPHLYSQQPSINAVVIAPETVPEGRTPQAVQPGIGGSVAYGSAWPSTNDDFTACSPTDTSCFVDMAGFRTYGSLGAPSQTHTFQPARQVQSAPLAAPPEFHLPDWTTPYQSLNASFPAALDYGQDPPAGQMWLSHQVPSPYQTHWTHSSAFDTHVTPRTSYNHGDITPKLESIDRRSA